MAAAASESAASRFDRDWAQIKDDRKTRGLDYQPVERKSRVYVDAATGNTPADDVTPPAL